MTNRVTSIQIGKEIHVTVPYNEIANKRFRELGGKFDYATKSWVFNEIVKEQLIKTLNDHYLEDGFTPVRRGTVIIHANYTLSNVCAPLYFAGRILAQAKARDGGAKISDGVVVLSGKVKSGGSVKNWETQIEECTMIAVHDMPESILKLSEDDDYDDFEILEFIPDEQEIVEEKEEIEVKQDTIMSDKNENEVLLKRIADLEARLAKMEQVFSKMSASFS